MFSTVLDALERVGSALASWITLIETSTGIPFWVITVTCCVMGIVLRLLIGPMIGGFSYTVSDSAKNSKGGKH